MVNMVKCTFSGVVPIVVRRFLDGGTQLIECPDCAAMRSVEPRNQVLRFKSHDKRKTTTPNTEQRLPIQNNDGPGLIWPGAWLGDRKREALCGFNQ